MTSPTFLPLLPVHSPAPGALGSGVFPSAISCCRVVTFHNASYPAENVLPFFRGLMESYETFQKQLIHPLLFPSSSVSFLESISPMTSVPYICHSHVATSGHATSSQVGLLSELLSSWVAVCILLLARFCPRPQSLAQIGYSVNVYRRNE